MQVSVIIPTFNRAQTIARAVDSVLAQSDPAVELIVVDDGSTDDTRALLENRVGVTLISQSNQGVSAARNAGIKAASGEWIAFLDSDDEWLPEKLKKQKQALWRSQQKICHTDEIWIRNGVRVNPKHKHKKPDGEVFEASLPLCCVSPSSIVLHRSVLDAVGVFDESLPACEDYDLWLRLFSRYPVTLVDEPLLVKYGGHDDQLSRKHWGMDRFRIKALCKVLDEGHLSESQANAALNTLYSKAEVLIKGCMKREKLADAEVLMQLRERYLARYGHGAKQS